MKKILLSSILLLVFFTSTLAAQTLAEAQKLLTYEKYNSAISAFEKLAAAKPNDAETLLYLGNAYTIAKRPEEAKATYGKLMSVDTKNPFSQIGVARINAIGKNAENTVAALQSAIKLSKKKNPAIYRWAIATLLMLDKPNTELAIAWGTKATELDKSDKSYMALGDAFYASQNAGKAVSQYEYAIEKNKTNPEPYYKIGVIWVQAKNEDLAVKSLKQAITLDPNFAPAYRRLGDFYYNTYRFNTATANYEKYMQLGEPSLEDWMQYANSLYLAEDYEKAITTIQDIIKKDASKNYLNRLIGYSYYKTEKYAEGLDFMAKFMENVPADKTLNSDYEYYGKLLLKNNKPDEAIPLLNKAYEGDTSKKVRADIAGLIADHYSDQKNYPEAIKYYELKISNLEKPVAQDFYDLGGTYYSSKDYKKADSLFTLVVNLRPDATVGYIWRAKSNARLESNENPSGLAKPHYEKFIEVATKDPETFEKQKKNIIESYNYLAYYYYKTNDYVNARLYCQKVLELDASNAQATNIIKAL